MTFLKNLYNSLKNIDYSSYLAKINIQKSSIVILILVALFFGYKWYFNDNNQALIDSLHEQNAKIEAERKVIAHQLDSLKEENKTLMRDKTQIETRVQQIGDLIDKYKKEGIKSKADLDRFKKDMDKISSEIETLIKNPKNRQDEELLNSIRNHFKEREKIYGQI